MGAGQRIVVVGAGGLGSYLGAALAEAGHAVTLVARGAHREAIEERGLCVRDEGSERTIRLACVSDAAEAEAADLAIVTVKAFSLPEVAASLADQARRGAAVLPLLNGVDAAERLVRSGVPESHVLAGVAYLTAFRTAPGIIERSGRHGRIVVGAPVPVAEPAVAAAREAFAHTPLSIEAVDTQRIHQELWSKMAVVCALSALCGLTRGPIGPIRRYPGGRALQDRAVEEVLTVGRSQGVAVGPDVQAQAIAILDGFPDDFYPSLLHDLRSGQRTEVEELCGTIVRLGTAGRIETPVHLAAACAVVLASRQRAG